MQFSLVISPCNITFWVFWISQGIVATLIRWGRWSSYYAPFISKSTSENCINIRWFLTKTQTKIVWSFSMAHRVYLSHYMKTWRHPQNRKYITYCTAVRRGPSHGNRWQYTEMDVWFLTCERTHRQTCWSQYFAPLLGAKKTVWWIWLLLTDRQKDF